MTALVAVLATAGCIRAEPPATSAGSDLIGAWRSQITFAAGPLAAFDNLEFLYAFNAGGTMTESSNYDEAANSSPPAYGTWRQVAPHKFEAKYVFFTTASRGTTEGAPTATDWWPDGHGELTETITLADDGQSASSAIRLVLFDRQGAAIEGASEGTGKARRISLTDAGR